MGYYRHPKTHQERKANIEGFCRAKRSVRMLPSVYDDIPKSDDGRNWKQFRKTQYKTVDMFESHPKRSSRKFGMHMSRRDHFHLEHRWCKGKYRRCNYCWKNGIWEDHDKEMDRTREQREREDKKRLEDICRILDSYYEDHHLA